MFGINDDDSKQDQPAGPTQSAPTSMPQPVAGGGQPLDDQTVNPISGNETLGPPQISSGLPSIIPGAGGSAPKLHDSIVPKGKMMAVGSTPTSNSSGPSMPADMPTHDEPVDQPADEPSDNSMPDLPEPIDKPKPVKMPSGSQATDLLEIKQEALEDLTPLVDKLDLPPEKKFKTLMMLLQASDNSDLVKDAYEAANKIDDEKVRAQALLDVVNEINYFTQSKADKNDDSV